VFWASSATVLTTFGIVPLQAGIFSTTKSARSFTRSFAVSQHFIPAAEQASALTLNYAQSVYGILKLNDSLPAFMTRDYALAPFDLAGASQAKGTWTASTTLYSLDLKCEPKAQKTFEKHSTYYMSSPDCVVYSAEDFGNDTANDLTSGYGNPQLRMDKYSAYYSGYFVDPMSKYIGDPFWGVASSGLADTCNPNIANGTFVAGFARNKINENDPKQVALTHCRMYYYQQSVNATVDAMTKAPVGVITLGPKQNLSDNLFNVNDFENTLASGTRSPTFNENMLPVTRLPRYLDDLKGLSQVVNSKGGIILHSMAAMAVTAGGPNLGKYLDPAELAKSYEIAYRLLFARAMVDVLKTDFTSQTAETYGQELLESQAVVLEPIFTHLVQALLGFVSLAAMSLMFIRFRTRNHASLLSDPGKSVATFHDDR